jgi:hypothetical protein
MKCFFMLILLGSLETAVFGCPSWMRHILVIKDLPAEIVTARASNSMPLGKKVKAIFI